MIKRLVKESASEDVIHAFITLAKNVKGTDYISSIVSSYYRSDIANIKWLFNDIVQNI